MSEIDFKGNPLAKAAYKTLVRDRKAFARRVIAKLEEVPPDAEWALREAIAIIRAEAGLEEE